MHQITLKNLNRIKYLVKSYNQLKAAQANVVESRGNRPLGFSGLTLNFGSKPIRVGTQFLEGFIEKEIERVKHALEQSGFNTNTLDDDVPDLEDQF